MTLRRLPVLLAAGNPHPRLFGNVAPSPPRHARACPGHPSIFANALSRSRWIAGSSPAVTIRSDLLDLTEFQFDRRGAAEDRHRDLHARARLVDFLDHAGERREG